MAVPVTPLHLISLLANTRKMYNFSKFLQVFAKYSTPSNEGGRTKTFYCNPATLPNTHFIDDGFQ